MVHLLDQVSSRDVAILVALTAALTLSPAANADLVVHYTFEETPGSTVIDSASTDGTPTPVDDGTLLGGAIQVAGGSPVNGGAQALSLVAQGDGVDAGNGQDYLQNVPGATFAAWIKPASSLPDREHFLYRSSQADGGRSRYMLAVRGDEAPEDTGTLAAFPRKIDNGNVANLYSTSQVALGEWQHVALVLDYWNAQYAFYIDGADAGSGSIDNWTTGSNCSDLVTAVNGVGQDGSGGRTFLGLMDDVRVYNHALGLPEIQELVPEPSTFGLTALGLLGLAGLGRRYRRCK